MQFNLVIPPWCGIEVTAQGLSTVIADLLELLKLKKSRRTMFSYKWRCILLIMILLCRVFHFSYSGTHWIGEIVQLIITEGDARKINRDFMVTVLEFTWSPTPENIKQTTPGYKIIEE